MLINEAAKMANLTKKAVEYYIEEKLVYPKTLENGYRDFSNQDIEILKQISLYRKLNLSIYEIKQVLTDFEALRSIMHKKVLELEKEKAKQNILQKLCDGAKLDDMEQEINEINSKSIIINRLTNLFPSYYGKFISLNFARYLNGNIETIEQMEAFHDIIEFFDEVPDFEIPLDLQEYLDEYMEMYSGKKGTGIIQSMMEERDKSIENIEEYVKQNREILEQYAKYKQTEEYINSPANRLMELMKQICSTNGYYDRFIPAMRRLSPMYNQYYEKLLKANEKFIKNYPELVGEIK